MPAQQDSDFAGRHCFFATGVSRHRVYHGTQVQPLQFHTANRQFRHDSRKVNLVCVYHATTTHIASDCMNPEYGVCLMVLFFALRYLLQNHAIGRLPFHTITPLKGHPEMTYSRVALLLALALVGQTANGWVIESHAFATNQTAIQIPPPSPDDFLYINPFQQGWWPGDKVADSDLGLNTIPSAGNSYIYDHEKQLRNECSQLMADRNIVSKLEHNAQSTSEVGIAQQLKAVAGRTIVYASRYWRQTVAISREHGPRTEAAPDTHSAIDEFLGTLSNPCPAEIGPLVSGKSSHLALIDYVYPELQPRENDAKAWFSQSENADSNWTDKQQPGVEPVANRVIHWAKVAFGGWKAAFRNTTHRFAQLNWTILLNGQIGGQDANNARITPRVIER
jgi:hypothetical protein